MSSTDQDGDVVRKLAGELHDEIVTPLAEARKAAGAAAYFPLGRDPAATTYFEEPATRVMTAADFEFPGGGTAEGLVAALAAAWTAEGEVGLAAMAPKLQAISEALGEEAAQGDGSVSILCYTMF